jgi:dolichol-phosphate mannosyltransferase
MTKVWGTGQTLMADEAAERSGTAPELAVIVPSFNERENVPALYRKLTAALAGTSFEMIVVDDNSPDGTAEVARALSRSVPNLRVIHRIGRRGLSSAVTEGMGATSAPFIAVIDADLQHDETILPEMLRRAQSGDDVVIGTRYAGGGAMSGGLSATREKGSRFATQLATTLTGVNLSDPMSGFFLLRREIYEDVAPELSRDGFKILLDIVVTATHERRRSGGALKVGEVPYSFRARQSGESKMSPLVVIQFLGLLVSKLTRGLLPTSFLLFALVGGSGVFVHLVVLYIADIVLHFPFAWAQLSATLVAMSSNFALNNVLTYADKRLKGLRFLVGLLTFYAVCSIGALANVSVAAWIYQASPDLLLAGLAGALMSVVFNYSVTRVFTWR